jgi:hypothetical protein
MQLVTCSTENSAPSRKARGARTRAQGHARGGDNCNPLHHEWWALHLQYAGNPTDNQPPQESAHGTLTPQCRHGQRPRPSARRARVCNSATASARSPSCLLSRSGQLGSTRRAQLSHHARNSSSRLARGFDSRAARGLTCSASAQAARRSCKGSCSRCIARLRGFGLCTRHLGGAGGADEFGPDAVPVVRAQIPAAHVVLAGSLQGVALFGGRRPYPIGNLRKERRRQACAACNASCTAALSRKVLGQIHPTSIAMLCAQVNSLAIT